LRGSRLKESLRLVPRRQREQILRAELVLAAAELAGDLGAAFGDHFFELAAVEEGEGRQGASRVQEQA
jgi:hypothetical protein